MTLREANPLVESDLELIITSFEKAMLKSRDVDSVLIPFKRQLDSIESMPESVVASIDKVPLGSEATRQVESGPQPVDEDLRVQADVHPPTPEEASDEPLEPTEDTEEEETLEEKVEEWVEDCIPCDFRIFSELDGEFFSDIKAGWEEAIDKVENNLDILDDLLQDVDVVTPLCNLGDMFKFHCVPDIDKIITLLSMFMDQIELEAGLDLGVFDSYLTKLLEPLLNELLSNLDLVDDLLLNPIKCVIDQIQKQINKGPEVAQKLYEAITTEGLREEAETIRGYRRARDRADQVLRDLETASETDAQSGPVPTESEEIAQRRRQESESEERSVEERTTSGLQRLNSAMESIDEALSFLNRFSEYVKTAYKWLMDKKDQLFEFLQDLVDRGLDYWNKNVDFAKGKKDLLYIISILKAIVDAAQAGDFSCGREAGSMTEDELVAIVGVYVHPNETLEVELVDDSIVARRVDPSGSISASGEILGVHSPDSISETPENVVVRKPISSCLKKITQNESAEIENWIKQLEEEI